MEGRFLIDVNGCVYVGKQIILGIISGITDLTDPIVSIYPNPVSDVLHIKSDRKIDAYKIFKLDGQVIRSERVNDDVWEVNLLGDPGGVYVIEVNSDGKRQVLKFMLVN